MIAEFYIVAESFSNNSNLTTPEIERRVKLLATDFKYIRKYRETNKLFVNPDIYNIYFIRNILLSDLLYNPLIGKKYLERDVYNALQKIIIESEQTNYSSEEVIEVLLPKSNMNRCFGLIAFNNISNVKPEFQIVYHLQGWFDFRRYYLGQFPGDANFFISECKKYFPDLIFHDNTISTINEIIDDFPKKIIYHLAALNDKFSNSIDGVRHRQQVLDHFSVNCNMDEKASLEGNADRKLDFTYVFVNSNGITKAVCCEPHIKLCKSDSSGDNTYYQHRIYFHEGFESIFNNKILIGHIGKHL